MTNLLSKLKIKNVGLITDKSNLIYDFYAGEQSSLQLDLALGLSHQYLQSLFNELLFESKTTTNFDWGQKIKILLKDLETQSLQFTKDYLNIDTKEAEEVIILANQSKLPIKYYINQIYLKTNPDARIGIDLYEYNTYSK